MLSMSFIGVSFMSSISVTSCLVVGGIAVLAHDCDSNFMSSGLIKLSTGIIND